MATLTIGMGDTPDPVVVGGNVTYTITIVNLGPDAATNVVLTDVIPLGSTLVSPPGGCLVLGQTITCTFASLTPGFSVSRTIVVQAPGIPGPIFNAASAQGDNTNLAEVFQETQVIAATTLTMTKTARPEVAFVGGTLTFNLEVTNTGATPALNVVLRDQIPIRVTFVSASVPCTLLAGNFLTCNLGTIPAGGTVTVTIQVIPRSEGLLTNIASAAGTNTNVASAFTRTPAICAADLALTKTANAVGQVNQGLTFRVTVQNLGPSLATSVRLVDTLPPSVRFISATPSQTADGGCTLSGRTLTCLLDALAPGATATVDILTVPTAPGRITNTAEVSSPEFDPDVSNNTASVTVTVNQCNKSLS